MKTRSNSISRLLSLVLCICMVLSLVPAIPLAAEAATPGGATKIYLIPNSNWKVDNARFAVYYFGNGEKWASMTDSNGDGIYEVDVPSGYPSVIFCRMNPGASANNWNNVWNQSLDLQVPKDNKTLYTVKEGTWSKGGGTWSTPSCDNVGHDMVNKACYYCKKTNCQINGHTFVNNACSVCQTAGRTVYFHNDWLWSDVQLYYFNDKGNNGWPGESMKLFGQAQGHDYYSMIIPVDCTGFIINGLDSKGDRYQTNDIPASTYYEGVTYYIDSIDSNKSCKYGAFPICYDFIEKHVWNDEHVCDWCNQSYCQVYDHEFEDNVCMYCQMTSCQYQGHTYGEDDICSICGVGKIWIFFENNWNWTNIHLYHWDAEANTNNGWPGVKMVAHKSVQTGTSGSTWWYKVQIPADVDGIIINGTDLSKETPEEQQQQTPDILANKTYNDVAFGNGITFKMLWDGKTNQVEAYHINDKWKCDAGHTEKPVTGYAATCTVDGLTDGVVCDVCGKTLKAQEVIRAGGHGDADENGRCDTCLTPMNDVFLAEIVSNLKGKIGLHYSFILSDAVLADADNAYVQFTVGNETVKIPVSQGIPVDKGGVYNYEFAYEVSAKEMTEDVTMQVYYQGQPALDRDHIYSVKKYAKNILVSHTDEASKNLVEAMVNYGAASQAHFGYKADDLANILQDKDGNQLIEAPDYSNVTIQGFNAVGGQGTKNVKFYSASLILKSETTVRFFFTGKITATYQGQALEVKQRSGLYYVDVEGIAAKNLDEELTITIDDGTESVDVSFVPMAYCQGVWNDTTGAFDQDLKNLVCSLYLYNQAANAYFKEN